MAKLVRTVLLKRVPYSGTPSTRILDIEITLPVWISPAAALVTAEVTRLVAPVWSSGPNGDGGTRVLQSDWAEAGIVAIIRVRTEIPTNAASPVIFIAPFSPL